MTEGTGRCEGGIWVGVCGGCGQEGRVFIGPIPAVKWACRPCNQRLYDATEQGQVERARRQGKPYAWEENR